MDATASHNWKLPAYNGAFFTYLGVIIQGPFWGRNKPLLGRFKPLLGHFKPPQAAQNMVREGAIRGFSSLLLSTRPLDFVA